VRDPFGERPDGPWAREQWEDAVRRVARYRAQYEITDPSDALGPRPETQEQRHDWKSAREAIGHAERQLGRDVGVECDSGFGIGF
jgi:hypothetical protein